jgi:cobalt/nickel transport system permease protein
VLACLLFVVAVVVTPRTVVVAFAAYACCLLIVARIGRIRLAFIGRRLAFEAPFLLFALALPFLATGPRVSVLGLSLSAHGLWGAWNVISKATLGVATTILLAATTPVAEILSGLERLHMPRALTTIAHFMVRYADVITGEMRRMRIARTSRAYQPRFFWQVGPIASSLGSLFVRSYERGERVYLAMVARGYTESIPVIDDRPADTVAWVAALSLPAAAAAIAGLAWVVQ